MGGCCGGANRVTVEFEYLVVEGATCDRCGDSREGVRAAVRDARAMLPGAAVELEYIERELDPSRLADSNRVLINGLPAEEWLGGSTAVSDCPSCSDLLDSPVCCRTVEVGGTHSDTISRELVLDAIMAAAGLAPAGVPGENCCGKAEGPSADGAAGSDAASAGGPPARGTSAEDSKEGPDGPGAARGFIPVILVSGPGCG